MLRTVRSFSLAAAAGLILFAGHANASLLTHAPGDGPSPTPVSPAFGAPVAGGVVGANYVNFGVDYTGNQVAVFNDGGPVLAFGGINSGNTIDLLSPVSGRIVVAGTTTQGLTDYLNVEAGFAADGSLLLQAFDGSGNVVGSATNGAPLGPHGRSTFTIGTLGGTFDIASFTVSTPAPGATADTFGVDQVTIDTPIGTVATPEPATIASAALAVIAGLVIARRRKA